MLAVENYLGNHFNVERAGDDWAIYRFYGTIESGDRETLILTTDAMDELCDYFSKFYAEDRSEITCG